MSRKKKDEIEIEEIMPEQEEKNGKYYKKIYDSLTTDELIKYNELTKTYSNSNRFLSIFLYLWPLYFIFWLGAWALVEKYAFGVTIPEYLLNLIQVNIINLWVPVLEVLLVILIVQAALTTYFEIRKSRKILDKLVQERANRKEWYENVIHRKKR